MVLSLGLQPGKKQETLYPRGQQSNRVGWVVESARALASMGRTTKLSQGLVAVTDMRCGKELGSQEERIAQNCCLQLGKNPYVLAAGWKEMCKGGDGSDLQHWENTLHSFHWPRRVDEMSEPGQGFLEAETAGRSCWAPWC